MIRTLWKTRRRKVMLAMVLLSILAGVFWWRAAHDSNRDIVRGKLGLTTKWGWVNWGHAIPDAPRLLLLQLSVACPERDGQIRLTLTQSMTGHYGPLRATGRLTRVYRAKWTPSATARTALAWAVFKDISEAFEDMQGSLPNVLDPASWRSAHRLGDITGNRLSFFAALHGLSLEQLREASGLVPADVALKQWDGEGGRSWERPKDIVNTALPDGRDPWNPDWEKGAPDWTLEKEERIPLEFGWR